LKILYTSLVNATILCYDISIVTYISNRKTEKSEEKRSFKYGRERSKERRGIKRRR
jgi:hypothetical protein